MKNQQRWMIAYAVGAVLAGSSVFAVERPVAPVLEFETSTHPVKPQLRPKPVAHAVIAAPAPELPTTAALLNAGFGTKSAFTTAVVPSPDSTTLSPPVTLAYSGGSPVLLVNDSGTNKGVESLITNSHNSTSALFGQTNGAGAGLTGYNSGTVGPGGKFGVTNSGSAQPGAFTTTNGTGPALLATVTTATSDEPAVLGQNTSTEFYGIGVEGQGNDYGVAGYGAYAGLYGSGTTYGLHAVSSDGDGVLGQSSTGIGVYGYSTSGYGVYSFSETGVSLYSYSGSSRAISADTTSGVAVYANDETSGYAVLAHSVSGYGIYASSDYFYGIWGQSKDQLGVVGEDSGNGVGVYGYSATGWAGYFAGKLFANSVSTSSDRNVKTKIHSIDGKAILDKVSHLPVSSWVFKSDPDKNHVGPMAQDFHAAFGLDGDDDKHINFTDIAGVSLAAIQELNKEMKERDAEKDAEIADLKTQLKSMNEMLSARMAVLEQRQSQAGVVTASLTNKP